MQSKYYDKEASEKLQSLVKTEPPIQKIISEALVLLKSGANPDVYNNKGDLLLVSCIKELRSASNIDQIYNQAFGDRRVSDSYISHELAKMAAFELMLALIRHGASPNVYFMNHHCYVTQYSDYPHGARYYYYRISPLGLVLLAKPDYLPFLLEKGAEPLTCAKPDKERAYVDGVDIGYDPVVIILLRKWLKRAGFVLSEQAVTVLANYKNELVDNGLVTKTNYLHTLDPRSAAGKVLWVSRGSLPCSLKAGALDKILKELNLSVEEVVAGLAVKGVVIDVETGCWKPASILDHARQTLRKIEINHSSRKFFNPCGSEIMAFHALKAVVYADRPTDTDIMLAFRKALTTDNIGTFFTNAVRKFSEKTTPIYVQIEQLQKITHDETLKMLNISCSYFNCFLIKADKHLIFPILVCLKRQQIMQLREISRAFEKLIHSWQPQLETFWNEQKTLKEPKPQGVPFFCKGLQNTHIVYAEFAHTIKELKQKLALVSNIPVDSLMLTYNGRKLEDEKNISESYVLSGSEHPLKFYMGCRGD